MHISDKVILLTKIIFQLLVQRDYLRKGRLTPPALFAQILAFFLWGCFSSIYILPDWPAVHTSPVLEAMGWALVAVGLVATFLAMSRLGPRRTLGQETNELKQTGFYRVPRNPQILAFGLLAIGFVVLWPSWYALGWVFLYAAIAHMMVITEEEHLRNTLGEEYLRYCEHAPRYLGLPRRL